MGYNGNLKQVYVFSYSLFLIELVYLARDIDDICTSPEVASFLIRELLLLFCSQAGLLVHFLLVQLSVHLREAH